MNQTTFGNQEPSIFPRQAQYLEKPLPSSEESEKLIVGSIILDNDIFDHTSGILYPEHFYHPFYRCIYAAMIILKEEARPIDPITIGDVIKRDGVLENIGGVSNITAVIHGLPFISNVDEHVTLVMDYARVRGIIRECNVIVGLALSGEQKAVDLIQEAETRIYAISNNALDTGFVTAFSAVEESISLAHIRAETGSAVTGLHTGFTDLDTLLQGLHKGQQIVIASRPSIGKTALMLTMAQNAALRFGSTVAIFSLEMSKDELADRMVCSEAKIDGYRYSSGQLGSDEWVKIELVRNEIQQSSIFIDDSPNISPTQMKSKLRRLQAKIGKPLDLVCIDYLQLMSDGSGSNSREQEVSMMSRQLKNMAREFNIPLVTLSQLNRQSENRANHRPNMSDLRESGAIEQDADRIIFIYREDIYQEVISLHTNIAELIVAKNRRGPTGKVSLYYDGPTVRFSDLVTQY